MDLDINGDKIGSQPIETRGNQRDSTKIDQQIVHQPVEVISTAGNQHLCSSEFSPG